MHHRRKSFAAQRADDDDGEAGGCRSARHQQRRAHSHVAVANVIVAIASVGLIAAQAPGRKHDRPAMRARLPSC
jgi:hypothetical protein